MVIGLDFGTSFTKVVVGEPRIRYTVPFDQYAVDESTLMLPSALCVCRDSRKCTLGINKQGHDLHDNLKMPLIERNFTDAVRARASAFLALVFRHTRDWLFDVHGSVYKDRNIEWFINVGLPTDSFDDEELTSVYTEIVRNAWHVSVTSGDVILHPEINTPARENAFVGVLQEEITVGLLPKDRISAFPEFAAQLSGYVRSPRRRNGLHAFVDVGGGTLDVTVFNVHENEGEDVYPIFDSRVKPLGVRYLTVARLEALDEQSVPSNSPFENLPSDAAFREKFGLTKEQLERADLTFRKRVWATVSECLRFTSQEQFSTAPQWDRSSFRYGEPVPGFYCGGGVFADFYSNLLNEFEERDPPFRVRGLDLPVPEDLVGLDVTPRIHARLAVAYGLSFDPFDIGQIRRKDEIKGMQAKRHASGYEDRYISKELV